jgi:hypothetical protein
VHIATTIIDQLDLLERSGLIVHHVDLHRSQIGISNLRELWNFSPLLKILTPYC